jgi:glutathione S-transferase
MEVVYIVIALALLQFFIFGGFVGWARVKFNVDAPAITGDPVFERYNRIHYNTMEQLVVLIPAMLMFGAYVNAIASAILGLVFIFGRTIYFRAYLVEPAKRGAGYGLSVFPITILLLGGLGGAIWALVGGQG